MLMLNYSKMTCGTFQKNPIPLHLIVSRHNASAIGIVHLLLKAHADPNIPYKVGAKDMRYNKLLLIHYNPSSELHLTPTTSS